MTKKDMLILAELNSSFKISKEPFKVVAKNVGITQKELFDSIESYKKKGIIKNFRAVVNHNKVGLKVNALVCWNVKRLTASIRTSLLENVPQISHAYMRKKYVKWPYSLYTMIHSSSKVQCLNIIDTAAGLLNCNDYRVLFTLKELKKNRPIF